LGIYFRIKFHYEENSGKVRDCSNTFNQYIFYSIVLFPYAIQELSSKNEE